MTYVPAQGDIVIMTLDPQIGHEQKGRRPVLVVSSQEFSMRTGLVMICPITNTLRGYPTHVSLDNRTKTTGVIMCEQNKSLDYKGRHAVYVETAPDDIVDLSIDILIAFMQ